MRIIGGKHKGRTLKPPLSLPVRPTTDFAKEGLFNVLNHRLDFSEISVLDLFCGTGSIGFEFVSRGAPEVISIDESYACIQFITKTCIELKITELRPMKSNALTFLKNNVKAFDVIFADPPFEFDQYDVLLELMVAQIAQHKDLLFILEHSERNNHHAHPLFKEERRYGSITFSFFSSAE